MDYSGAHAHGSTYHYRHRNRSGLARFPKLRHRLGRLILNLCLLASGGAFVGAAIHYYFLGQDYEAKSTLDSADRARGDYSRTIFYGIIGAIPLMIGIRGEAKRLRLTRRRRKPSGDSNR